MNNRHLEYSHLIDWT